MTTAPNATSGVVNYLDPSSLSPSEKPWSKSDTQAVKSFSELAVQTPVYNARTSESELENIDVAGFALRQWPSSVPAEDVLASHLAEGTDARAAYYAEIEGVLRHALGARVAAVVIWDHTIRARDPLSPRQPVQSVHVDQTPAAALSRVRRHAPAHLAAAVDAGARFQLINVWRPLGAPAADHPLALLDWRSTAPDDLVPIDLLYPVAFERGREVLPDPASLASRAGYQVGGETYRVKPSAAHKWWYVKDTTPDEVVFIKCYDSAGEGQPHGVPGVAGYTPHTAFDDPATPEDALPRKSVEVRCLVFYDS